MVDKVEEGRLGPVQVVEDADDGRHLLEQLAERPGDLVGGRGLLRLAEQRRDRGGGAGVGWPAAQLEDDLDQGPVGDPLAVREAAAPHHRQAVERADELGRQA